MPKKRKSLRGIMIGLILKLVVFCLLIIGLFIGSIFIGIFGPLPDTEELLNLKDETATLVYSSDKVLIGKIFAKNRTPVSIDVLPDYLIDALISTEDIRYYEHNGVDSRSLIRVIVKSILMGNQSSGGGSTITQQLAKNIYGRESYGILSMPVNKIRESFIAVRIEDVYNKQDILQLYLNSVPFGEDVYGIEAAANRYFNKKVSALDIDESALLIGMLKGNTYYHPRIHPERARDRRNLVLKLMNENGKISEDDLARLISLPLGLDYSNFSQEGPAQYFLYQVEKKANEIIENIEKEKGIRYDLEKDGLLIETTLDMKLQEIGLQSVRKQLSHMQDLLDNDPNVKKEKNKLRENFESDTIANRELWSWDGVEIKETTQLDSAWHYMSMLNAGTLILEPESGKVRVWIGGNHFRYLPYDLVLSKRMIASAFKPILYATALEDGFQPCDYLDNEEKVYEEYDDWAPKNYDGTSGDERALWYSLVHSLNIPTVDLYFKVGYQKLAGMCYLMDIEQDPPDNPSIALGTMSISLLEATRVYAAFANKGLMNEEIMIERILDSSGNPIYTSDIPDGKRVVETEVANTITAILQKAVNEGTGARLRSQYQLRSEIAGKTGTSQNYSDAWFFSYTSGLTCGVWVGARDPSIHFSKGAQGSGSALALPIAGNLLQSIEKQKNLRDTYMTPFRLSSHYEAAMECEGIRTKGALNRFFENIFQKKEGKKVDSTETNEGSKVKKFFNNLFKKKDRKKD